MYKNNTTIKSWAEEDRPREKMQLKGRHALSNAELLAIVLGSGSKTKTAVELSQEILSAADNSLYKLGKFSQQDFMAFHGVGPAKSISIMAVLELGRRRSEDEIVLPKKISAPEHLYQYLKPIYSDLSHEEFHILGLTNSNRPIQTEMISRGGLTGTIADGRLIFKKLLDMGAASCVLSHNHPSGNLTPSQADIVLTKKFVEFGRLINISILDHIIISDNGYYSFSNNGRI